jgi:deoxyribose-phosphate aldolase
MFNEEFEKNISENSVSKILNDFNKSFIPGKLLRKRIPKEELAKKIDHTLLKPDATSEEIKKLCGEALRFKFASVCCNSSFVSLCRELLKDEITICSVVGFPFGTSASEVKRYEAAYALSHGAKEIDMVLGIGMLKEKNFSYVFKDIGSVAAEAKKSGALCKVILENCLLTDEEKITACLICREAGADFVKTSTGFGKCGAVVRDVALMKFTVGDKLKIKAAGGIRNREDAELMIAAGADRIGASASVKIINP